METDGRAGGNTNAERSSRCLFGDAKGAVEHVVKIGGVAAGFSRKNLKSPCHSDSQRKILLVSPVPTEFVPIHRWTNNFTLFSSSSKVASSFIHLSWLPASIQQRYDDPSSTAIVSPHDVRVALLCVVVWYIWIEEQSQSKQGQARKRWALNGRFKGRMLQEQVIIIF